MYIYLRFLLKAAINTTMFWITSMLVECRMLSGVLYAGCCFFHLAFFHYLRSLLFCFLSFSFFSFFPIFFFLSYFLPFFLFIYFSVS